MIEPVTPEDTWRRGLAAVPAWQPPLAPTLVIAPHPDDEALAAGGLIAHLRARGVPVTVAAVTDGEKAYGDTPGLGPIREREQTAALARLGVEPASIFRLHLDDSGVAAHEALLADLLAPFAPAGTHIVAPWRHDFHPDHEACGRAAADVAARTGATLTSWLFWTWHRGTPELLASESLAALYLSEGEQAQKRAAVAEHRSQLAHPSGQPILPANLLLPAQRPFEVFLRA